MLNARPHDREASPAAPRWLSVPATPSIAAWLRGLIRSPQRWSLLATLLAVNVAFAALLVALDRLLGIDYWNLVRDTNAIAGQPSYYGFYANLNVLIWAIAASISLFAWATLSARHQPNSLSRPLLLGGVFTAIACLDDLYMLHEHSYLIGIDEKLAMGAYALLLLVFVVSVLPVAARTSWLLLAAALVFLGLSQLVDMADLQMRGGVLMEEVAKFAGVSFLAAYLVTLAFAAIVHGDGEAASR